MRSPVVGRLSIVFILICMSLTNPNELNFRRYLGGTRNSILSEVKAWLLDKVGLIEYHNYIFFSVAHVASIGSSYSYFGAFKHWWRLPRVTCSQLNDCSGHGSCILGNICYCFRGWQGSDCSQIANPTRIPIFDDHTPVEMYIVAANICVWILWHCLDKTLMERHFTLSVYGISQGRIWTLVTCFFSHDSLGHLLWNLSVLMSTIDIRELTIDSKEWVQLYFLGGLLSSLTSLILNEVFRHRYRTSSLGASSPLYALLAMYSLYWGDQSFAGYFSSLHILVAHIALDLALNTPIDGAMHLGGLIAGVLYYFSDRIHY
mmetsp:Transcript_21743/g.35960  ORF Transcript_21743/g.35960 Transcript_21743/m.35960 type:complete len:317 (+) Transcript_21743:32-982(+)